MDYCLYATKFSQRTLKECVVISRDQYLRITHLSVVWKMAVNSDTYIVILSSHWHLNGVFKVIRVFRKIPFKIIGKFFVALNVE